MRSKSLLSARQILLASAVACVALATPRVQAQTFSVIHSFAGNDGSGPLAGLLLNKGTMYGVTSDGGQYGEGVVYKVNASGNEAVIRSFLGGTKDGANPQGKLIMDGAGNLYGTTYAGGTSGVGTVFKLSPKGVETVLYNFAGAADGSNPVAGLVRDKSGNLYGTTSTGGANGLGTIFEVSAAGIYALLYNFGGGYDGTVPIAGVTVDATGNLYGTTSTGGTYGYGTIFKLSLSQSGWTESVLYNFQMLSDGGTPYAGLTFDRAGNLYGAATDGGTGSSGGGTIFELTQSGGVWNFHVLYGLAGWGISGEFRNLLFDAKTGAIYGTTHCDGNSSAGTVFSLTPSGGTWSYSELYTFTGGADGLYSFSNLVMDGSGYLYGTTNRGGANGLGVVFQVKP